MSDPTLDVLHRRLNLVEGRITDPSFLTNQGLGNEVSSHIFDYPAAYELVVRDFIEGLCDRLNRQGALRWLDINVFEVMITILRERGFLEQVYALQKREADTRFRKQLAGTIDEAKVAAAIRARVDAVPDLQLVSFSGFGSAWPLLRANRLITVQEPLAERVPCVYFYPGTYTQQDLHLFDRIPSKEHYRAFSLITDERTRA